MFLRVAGRVVLNAGSLNTQGGAGTNYIEMTKVPVVVRSNSGHRIVEVPAVSGNMVRHCHFTGFLEEFRRSQHHGRNLTRDAWERDVALRFAQQQSTVDSAREDGNGGFHSVNLTESEEATIRALADADLYGFLVTATRNFRRTSILGFSFFLPVEEIVEEVEVRSVIHNRVVVNPGGMVDPAAMMPFKREYSSAVYGFAAFLDAAYIGRSLANRAGDPVVEQAERRERARAAILGFVQLLSGRAGAGLSRGLPVSRLDSLAVGVSERPIPLLVNGYYEDYIRESRSLLAGYSRLTEAAIRLHVYEGAAAAGPDSADAPPVPSASEQLTVIPHSHWVDLLRTVTDEVVSSQEFSDRRQG